MPQPRCNPATAIPTVVDAAIVSRRPALRVTLAVSLAIRALCALAISSVGSIAPAAENDGRATFILKLEYEMRDRRGMQASDEQLLPAGLSGISELKARAAAADDLVKALEQDQQKWTAELATRENLISELEQALESQNQTIRLLEQKALQPAQLPVGSTRAGTQTWGLAGWDPRELRSDDIRNFTHSPTAAERALTVAVVVLLLYALYLRLRVYKNLPVRFNDRHTAHRGAAGRNTPQTQNETQPSPRRRDEVDPKPMAAEMSRHEPPAGLNMSTPQLRPEDESTPPAPGPETPQSLETAPPTVRLGSEELLQQPPTAPGEPVQQSVQSPVSTPSSPRQRQRADPEILREVDALIAFEHFHEAADLLAKVMVDNPEYRLRSLYIRNALGDYERIANDQSILEAMMDGPMSDTLGRVIQAGRGLLPDHPLFESKDTAANPTPSKPLPSDDPIAHSDDVIDEFNESTFSSTDIERGDKQPKTD